MRRFVFFFATLSVFIFLAGCGGMRTVSYNAGIESVERPADTEKRYGEYEVTERDTTKRTKYVYEDDLIRAGWVYSGGSLIAILKNKTDYTIQARLEQGAFITPNGSSQRILTGNMSYAERNDKVRPVTIPSGASTQTVLIPAGNVTFDSYSGATVNNMFQPSFLSSTGSSGVSAVEKNLGETFSILLPLEIQGTVNEYTFMFEVNGAKIDGTTNKEPQTIGEYPTN